MYLKIVTQLFPELQQKPRSHCLDDMQFVELS